MKKLAKVLALMALSVVVCLGVFAFAACGSNGETYEGDYHYTQSYGESSTTYGIKVKVTVKDGKITKVEKVDSDYVECTALGEYTTVPGTWDETTVGAWNNGLADLLKAYEGKTVEEIKAVTVTVNNDVPNAVSNEAYVIAKCTQGSGRLVLAVQNALSKIEA